ASNLISGDFNNREDVFAFNLPLLPVGVASRKTHGSAGTYDVDLALGETECRSGGATGNHQVVVTFALPVTFNSAAVTSGTGSVVSASPSGNAITVNLTGVFNAQTITITLAAVNDGSTTSD